MSLVEREREREIQRETYREKSSSKKRLGLGRNWPKKEKGFSIVRSKNGWGGKECRITYIRPPLSLISYSLSLSLSPSLSLSLSPSLSNQFGCDSCCISPAHCRSIFIPILCSLTLSSHLLMSLPFIQSPLLATKIWKDCPDIFWCV